MLPYSEFRILDINAESLGVPTALLMENAGRAVAKTVSDRFGAHKRIAVLCGTGNNGGDGFVAARYLKRDNKVSVLLAKPATEIKTAIAKDAYLAVKDLVGDASEDLSHFDVIIDALLGTGTKGHLAEPYSTLIERIDKSSKPIVAVDVPSGLGTDKAVRPTITVTFHDSKEGMSKDNSGEIVIADIGIPLDAAKYVGPGEFVLYPIPSPDSHKGMNGRVLVIGGGPYTGAPALAGFGAYRIKVDLVRIATPARSYLPIAGYSPNFIVHELSGDMLTTKDVPSVLELIKNVEAVLIGPGLGSAEETLQAIREIVKGCDKPLVIDADAITAVSKDRSVLAGKTGVITPHAGEFATLSGGKLPAEYEERKKPAMELAATIGFTILLKGRIDVVADGRRCKLNRTGNAGMSVGGTGDVLAGEVAGLLSRGVAPFDAARIAAFVNGAAGDLAYQTLGFSLLATDVIDRVPLVLKEQLDRYL
ncbi:MAG: NAD(P)H-hydrate dehydratase [Methanomassiliicoccales archaeon]|nr:NAD(P)H-hydrate dehydratase [Methanomassiliicoccales archaeon]